MLTLRSVAKVLSVGLMVIGAASVSGQGYPNRPIRIATVGAGGGSDFIARVIAPGLSAGLGQPVIVDNRTSITAAVAVSGAPPDGYTLLLGSASTWIPPLLQQVPYDMKDFAPVSLITRELQVLVVHPSLPVNSVNELIALAKAKPGELNFAGATVGGAPHLAGELFKAMAGVKIVYVAYKGTGPALVGVMGNEAQLMFADVGLAMTNVKAGKLRALAVTSAEPSALVPGLPTVAASGVPGYEAVSMTGVFTPDKTPMPIINRLNQELLRALNLPEVKEKYFNAAVEVVGSSPQQFAAAVKAEVTRIAKVIKDAGIKIQ